MHGFSSGSTLLVNAEVDSMGGVIDGGVDSGTKTSPRRVAIEKAQAELRVEYDVREERRRELEFLEKGGNPLDFKLGHAASVSVHSTSLTGQNPDHIVISEAKGSFALTASPRGDSVESSGRLAITVAGEPNSADNFDGDHEFENDRKSVYPSRSNINPPGHASQLDWSRNAKEPQDSPIFYPKKGQAYRRRYRSRPNRDAARSSSTDVQSRAGHLSSLPCGHAVVSKETPSDSQLDAELDRVCATNSIAVPTTGVVPESKLEALSSKDLRNDLHDLSAKADEVLTSGERLFIGDKEHVTAGGVECRPCPAAKEVEKDVIEKLDGHNKLEGDGKGVPTEGLATNVVNVANGLDFESCCSHTSVSADVNGTIDIGVCNLKKVDSNGAQKEYKLLCEEKSNSKDDRMMDMDSLKVYEKTNQVNGLMATDKEEPHRSPSQNEARPLCNKEERESASKSDMQLDAMEESKRACSEQMEASIEPPLLENSDTNVPCPSPVIEVATCKEDQPKVVDKEHEDMILEEARIIEAKRKRIAQLSVGTLPNGFRRKSQWDFVLEEMAWLANDFAQERLWKMTSAAQVGLQAAFASRLRLEERNKCGKQKVVANTLAKAVMEFWRSAALLLEDVHVSSGLESCKDEAVASRASYEAETAASEIAIHEKEPQCKKNQAHGLQGYAVRFLQYNTSTSCFFKFESSGIPEGTSDVEMPQTSWQDQFTEENLFYTVAPGMMEAYRKSIELHLEQFEKTGNNMQEQVDTSMYDAAAEFCSQDNGYEEDEGENVYDLSGNFDGRRSFKIIPKKRKYMKSYAAGSYEMGGDLAFGHCAENRIGSTQTSLMGKRPANSINAGPIPTKRMRTASRQRVVGPSYGGSSGFMPAPSRNDASSGDTNSFQDDQSSLHGGSNIPKGFEVDSGMNFEKHCKFVSADISGKPKKKKKTKNQGITYDHRWQTDSNLQTDQKDHLKKRLDNRQIEANGSTGLFGQFAKKPKMIKQSLDNSFENATMSGSIASPVGSQMSNMSNPSKLIRFIGGRDRGRKAKAPKVPTGLPGSGCPWTLFEDQALVVLVHDMGPNWELVSNAINSTLQFKCIYRKPQECKERHKALMDRTAGDGADSADDSGSSQPYPSTLPGIPKGSAMQLFQRLQGPLEEEAIKSHFEKIISIGKQLHYRWKKSDTQDLKQLAPVHGSHVAALSQVVPNNVNGGVLTPLDLCDSGASSSDFLIGGYQGSFSGSLTVSHQGAGSSTLPSSGANSSMQGSPGMGVGGSLTSPSAQLNGSVRDRRYGVPRPNIPIDDQQRLQQYNQTLSNRNLQQSNGTGPGSFPGTDQGVRMFRGGGGMGIMSGMNRSMPVSRPGIQGIPSSSMHSGSMVAPSMGMSSTMNMQPGASPGQANSVRVHGPLHILGIGQNPEQQRQMMSPGMPMQVTQPCSQAISSFGGMSSAFPDQSASPTVQQYAAHHQQHKVPQQHRNVFSSPHHSHLQGSPHPTPHDQQAYAVRLARDRQLHQRMLQRQQHQQFPASSALMSQVATQNQLPISSPLHNNTQIQSHDASPSVSLSPGTPSSPMSPAASQQQQKHHLPPQGLGRNSQGGANGMVTQMGKQRRQSLQLQQQYQQSGRHHPQQRQQSQPQQSKLLKGVGRGNLLMQQSLSADHSHPNGLPASTGNQVTEKGEQAMHMMQGPSLYSGSGLNASKITKPLLSAQPSSQSQPQQKQCSTSAPSPSKLVQQMASHPDSSKQSQVCTASPLSASKHALSPSATPSLNHQLLQVQPQPPKKLASDGQPNIQRAVQQNGLLAADSLTKLQSDQAQVDLQFTKTSNTSSGTPPSRVESANAIPFPSASNSANRKGSEYLSDSVIKKSSAQVGPIGIPPSANSQGSEPLPSSVHGLGQRQISGSLPSREHNARTQWQLPSQKRSQQSVEHSPQRQPEEEIPAGQSSPLTKGTNSRLE